MEKTCKDCRFLTQGTCSKYCILVNENYKICKGFADKQPLNESMQKIQLND